MGRVCPAEVKELLIMTDEISFKMSPGLFHQGIKDREARMRRAAMWAVRSTGRVVRTEARRRAPVLADPTGTYAKAGAYRRAFRARKAGAVGPIAGEGGPIVGLLRQSIAPSKHFRKGSGLLSDSYSIKVGPRGPRVHLYAAKIEELEPYMEAGRDAGQAAAAGIWAEAAARAWRV
jgi:hypothetical protein